VRLEEVEGRRSFDLRSFEVQILELLRYVFDPFESFE